MKATLTVTDTITPQIRAMIKKLDGSGRQRVMEVIGVALRNWAMEAFTDPSMRPTPWKAKMDGSASTLQGKSPVLRRSLRVTATAKEAVIGTDRKYALIHQLGGVIKAKDAGALHFQSGGKWFTCKQVTMPARPFLPVMPGGGIMPAAAEDAMDAAIAEITAGPGA